MMETSAHWTFDTPAEVVRFMRTEYRRERANGQNTGARALTAFSDALFSHAVLPAVVATVSERLRHSILFRRQGVQTADMPWGAVFAVLMRCARTPDPVAAGVTDISTLRSYVISAVCTDVVEAVVNNARLHNAMGGGPRATISAPSVGVMRDPAMEHDAAHLNTGMRERAAVRRAARRNHVAL
jgi:hypothetical protein